MDLKVNINNTESASCEMTAVVNTPGLYVTPEMDDTGSKDIREPSPSCATVFLNIYNSITYLCLGAAACCGFITALSFDRSVRTHIFLCTTGYVIMMGLAVITLSPYTTGWTKGMKYKHKIHIVAMLQLVGIVLAIYGSAIIIRDRSSDISITKAHGFCGLCALVSICLNYLYNIVSAFLKIRSIPEIIRNIQGLYISTTTSIFNNNTLLFAFLSLCLGYDKFLGGEKNDFGIFAIIITVIAMIGVATSAVTVGIRRREILSEFNNILNKSNK